MVLECEKIAIIDSLLMVNRDEFGFYLNLGLDLTQKEIITPAHCCSINMGQVNDFRGLQMRGRECRCCSCLGGHGWERHLLSGFGSNPNSSPFFLSITALRALMKRIYGAVVLDFQLYIRITHRPEMTFLSVWVRSGDELGLLYTLTNGCLFL